MTTTAPNAPPRLITLVFASAANALAINLFLPSLPAMARAFEVDYALIQLTVSVYLLAMALLQLLIGPASDRYGRRPVMIGCFLIFIMATMAILFSPNFEFLLAMRMLQAFSAAGVVLSRAIVRDLVEPERSASMIAYITMGMALAPMIAPTIGGFLDEYFGWQASFLALLAFGILIFLFILFDLGETHHARSSSMLAQMRSYPELLLSPRYWAYVMVAAFTSGQFFAFLGGGPFVATEIMELTPSQYGMSFGILSVGFVIGNFISGRRSERYGIPRMIFAGNLCALSGALGSMIMLQIFSGHPMAFFGPLVMVGIGNGIAMPNAMAGMVSVRRHLVGSASGLGAALQIGIGAMLSVLGGAFLQHGGSALPLLFVMLGTAALSLLFATCVIVLERRKAAS